VLTNKKCLLYILYNHLYIFYITKIHYGKLQSMKYLQILKNGHDYPIYRVLDVHKNKISVCLITVGANGKEQYEIFRRL
jgi:hypothetical protein